MHNSVFTETIFFCIFSFNAILNYYITTGIILTINSINWLKNRQLILGKTTTALVGA